MNNDYIAVLDSGIGGISVLNELLKLMPNQNFIYFGDNKNAPYGSKNLKTLLELTKSNLDYLTSSFNLKGLVLGCNTLSVNFLSQIQDYSGLKTFGVFPPVESAILKGKTLLLATERTAERYSGVKNLFAVGLKDLAGEIEKNAFCLENVCFERHLNSLGLPQNFLRDFETLILGCTHYNFIKNKITAHLKPPNILSGEFFTAKIVSNFYKTQKSLVKHYQNKVLFVGENACFNKKFFEKSGQSTLKLL